MRNEIIVISLEKSFKRFEKDVKKIAGEILDILRKNNLSVEIYLVGDQRIKELNRRFGGKNQITNILSFPAPKNFIYPKSIIRPIGEIYLNLDYIERKRENLNCLIIHGTLHLLGYNHKKKIDRTKMEEKEARLLCKMTNNQQPTTVVSCQL